MWGATPLPSWLEQQHLGPRSDHEDEPKGDAASQGRGTSGVGGREGQGGAVAMAHGRWVETNFGPGGPWKMNRRDY